MPIRKAVFAGSWYPDRAAECEREIRSFLQQGKAARPDASSYLAGIVPHAGWYFSGSIACNVIHCLSSDPQPDLVAIFGMHLHDGSPCYMMPEGAWETPFGEIPVDEEMGHALAERFTFHLETPTRFSRDNTIELQMPFVRYFFKNVRVLALGLPPKETSLEIARTLISLAGEQDRTLRVIGSTDLTHYGHNYGFAPKGTGPAALDWVRKENDRRFVDALVAMNPQQIMMEGQTHQNACCSGAAASAVAAALALGATRGETLAYATSHDKHPGDSFVGYAGVLYR